MTLSKKAVRPAQTSFLLENGILPVSLDYRLCPEINLIDGPITDAYAWAKSTSRTGLQGMLKAKPTQIQIDIAKIVVIGGHLAMTTAWTKESRADSSQCHFELLRARRL